MSELVKSEEWRNGPYILGQNVAEWPVNKVEIDHLSATTEDKKSKSEFREKMVI